MNFVVLTQGSGGESRESFYQRQLEWKSNYRLEATRQYKIYDSPGTFLVRFLVTKNERENKGASEKRKDNGINYRLFNTYRQNKYRIHVNSTQKSAIPHASRSLT